MLILFWFSSVEAVNLSSWVFCPILLPSSAGLLFAMVMHMSFAIMSDGVPCTWLPTIACQGLYISATNSQMHAMFAA